MPVVQGTTNAVTITFRNDPPEFQTTIAGDVIRLHVRPEVSALDFNNGVTLSGFRIPALTTRYAETEVELRDGQSFAIAGLLDNVRQDDKAAIPFLSKVPIIGPIFKSKATRKEQTELMVLITSTRPRSERTKCRRCPPAFVRSSRRTIRSAMDGAGGVVDAPRKDKPAAPAVVRKRAAGAARSRGSTTSVGPC